MSIIYGPIQCLNKLPRQLLEALLPNAIMCSFAVHFTDIGNGASNTPSSPESYAPGAHKCVKTRLWAHISIATHPDQHVCPARTCYLFIVGLELGNIDSITKHAGRAPVRDGMQQQAGRLTMAR